MTIKELIEFTSKSERTIRNWIKKADIVRYAETAQRIEIDYTIDEVEEILKAGSMSKDAVNILMQNARQEIVVTPAQNNDVMGMFKLMMDQQQTFMVSILGEIKNIAKPQTQLMSPKEDYFSLVAYCSLHKIQTNRSELAIHGRKLREIANSLELEIKKIPDERWGKVNSYPVEVLDEYFSI